MSSLISASCSQTPFHVSDPRFSAFFRTATDVPAPYAYQVRLSGGDPGRACTSQLIDVPTGLGKTAAVVLAWLWNRIGHPDPSHREAWPRRLVYCLPMRTLVEQTSDEVHRWLDRLVAGAAALGLDTSAREQLAWLKDRSPVILMGGEEPDEARREWDIHPERPAILIGTQDMLLSRALNRGYGMSRYRWPMHFSLLNNDCLSVMDETQLMGVGVETSAQLDGFRSDGRMPALGACPTWWMSATLDDSRLGTVDHRQRMSKIELSPAERTDDGRPKDLITAKKGLSPATLTLNSATKSNYPEQLAELIAKRHRPNTLTLVVVNRVSRARQIFQALTTARKMGKQPMPALYDPMRVALIHSRFRPADRERHTRLLFGEGDRIVIATQAVEAGVDVSARLLITELAPWSSLVQRIGRCNRRANIADAEVLWLDVAPKDENDDLALPYKMAELDKARAALAPLSSASPQALRGVAVPEEKIIRPVIRRRDLVDLFDTTPDICGQDLDVSRYIRDGEDIDVQFFWRNIAGDVSDEKPPQREELCRVSIGDAAKFLKDDKKVRAWRWNPLDKKWESQKSARPGGIYLIGTESGGYSDSLGWTGELKDKPTPHAPTTGSNEAHESDPNSFSRSWQSITEHTALVVTATDTLAATLALDADSRAALHAAALWHDVGKAHDEFQAMLRNADDSLAHTLWAKSANKDGQCSRRGFRHELASALAWLLAGPRDAPERDLVAYLIAAHHGKVRLSIRSLPNETAPYGEDRLFARGLWHGDKLPAVSLGEITAPEVTLDLSFMQMGEGSHGPSWLARTISLRDRLGPFRLAFLETVLRAADARASRQTQAD